MSTHIIAIKQQGLWNGWTRGEREHIRKILRKRSETEKMCDKLKQLKISELKRSQEEWWEKMVRKKESDRMIRKLKNLKLDCEKEAAELNEIKKSFQHEVKVQIHGGEVK